MTQMPWSKGCSMVWDVTVVDGLAPSRVLRNIEAGDAAEYAETRKERSSNSLSAVINSMSNKESFGFGSFVQFVNKFFPVFSVLRNSSEKIQIIS